MGVINNVKALISTSKLTNLANAIRNKTGEVKSYTIDEMIEKINEMGSSVLTSLSVTTNGTYTPESGVDGFSQVDVDVNPDLRPLSVSENGTYQPDGFDGFSQVDVDVTGILDSLLEIVSSVTPEQNAYSFEFPCDKKTGAYIIVSDPPGTREFASQQRLVETLNMVQFDIRGVPGALQSYDARSICYHKNPSSSHETDWWTAKINLGENSVTVEPTSGRYPFLAGVTYYLLRVKGA